MKKLAVRLFVVGMVLFCLSGCDQARKPTADFGVAPATGAAPLLVTFTNLSTGGGPFSVKWQWDFGDGSGLSTDQAPTHTYTVPGSYDVTLRMSTWLGEAESVKAAAVVVLGTGGGEGEGEDEGETEIAPTAAFDATPRSGTAPVEVQFSDASVAGTGAITGWTWDFGDGATANEQNPRHTYTAPGGYTVQLTVVSGTLTNTAVKAGFIQVSPAQTFVPVMTRTISNARYVPGATLDVTLALEYPAADITALGITEQIPAGWIFQGVVGGTSPSLSRINPETAALELGYAMIPAFPFGVTYRLLVPADAVGTQSFSGRVLYRTDGPELETTDVVSTIDAQPTVEGEGEGEVQLEGEEEGEGEGEAPVEGEVEGEGEVVAGVYSADFSTGDHGWVAGFADLPADATPQSYGLESGLRAWPVQTFAAANALYIAGSNHSDDLFMYFKHRVTGLEPDTEYRVAFQADFFSPYPTGSMGIGGSPADSVYLKAGASTTEPSAVVDGQDSLRMNIDKGNQAVGGANAVVLGTIGKPDDGTDNYVLLDKESTESFTTTTDAEGGAWLFFGTDSGYEGITRLYYTAFKASFSLYTPPPDATAAVLSVKHTVSTGDSYTPGQTLDVTLHVDRVGRQPLTSLACMEMLPAGWTYEGLVSGPFPETRPNAGDGEPQFGWTNFVPRVPFTLTYRVSVPEGQTGIKDLAGWLMYSVGTGYLPSSTELVRLRPATGNDTFISLARQVNPLGVYFPGQPVDITLRLEKHGEQPLYGLAGTDALPPGWTVQTVDGPSVPPIWKVVAGGGSVEFGWVTVPAFPVEFSYHILPPSGASGMVQFSGRGLYRFSGSQLETNTDQLFMVPGVIR